MPCNKPKPQPAELSAIPAELLEQSGNGQMTAEAINAATLALKKAPIERAPNAPFYAGSSATCTISAMALPRTIC